MQLRSQLQLDLIVSEAEKLLEACNVEEGIKVTQPTKADALLSKCEGKLSNEAFVRTSTAEDTVVVEGPGNDEPQDLQCAGQKLLARLQRAASKLNGLSAL